jgi:hypothetical protein
MPRYDLAERIRFSIELALTAGHDDGELHSRQDAEGRSIGMSGAEIDAARSGRSFDAQISGALALAIARDGSCASIKARAHSLGVDEEMRAAIRNFVRAFLENQR